MLNKQTNGFTLIEVIVVVLMVGILSAIAAPSWLGFVNRQRLNKANDAVLATLQQAQREAKRTKLNYSVSFKVDTDTVPKVAIYPADSTPSIWTSLGEDIGLKPGQVLLYTNIDTANKVGLQTTLADNLNPKTITFDYRGTLPLGADTGLKIVVAEAKSGTSLDSNTLKRCVVVETLLGGMRTAQDAGCN